MGIPSLGGPMAVTQRMWENRGVEKVQTLGCTILRGLIDESLENLMQVMKAGGCQIVQAVLDMHPCSPAVQEHGGALLREMAKIAVMLQSSFVVLKTQDWETVQEALNEINGVSMPKWAEDMQFESSHPAWLRSY